MKTMVFQRIIADLEARSSKTGSCLAEPNSRAQALDGFA
jgi:hypothetical protein